MPFVKRCGIYEKNQQAGVRELTMLNRQLQLREQQIKTISSQIELLQKDINRLQYEIASPELFFFYSVRQTLAEPVIQLLVLRNDIVYVECLCVGNGIVLKALQLFFVAEQFNGAGAHGFNIT